MRFALMASTALIAGTAQAEAPQVVADIAPIHALVARVMDGVGEPTLLVEPGASPHGYALRPSRAAALDRAQAVFWMGEALEPWLEGPLETLGGQARIVELMEVPGTTVLEFREGATFEGHSHEADGPDAHAHEDDHDDHDDHGHDDHDKEHEDHGHDDHDKEHEDHAADAHEEDHDDHGHAHEGADPHGWLDPMNAHVWLGAIADTLSEIDPENATRYAANAAEGRAELDALTAELYDSLTQFRDTRFIVFHDAYHYFENRFDLSAAGAISLSDASDPGAKRIAQVRHTVQEMGVTCVFAEPQFNAGLVKAVTDAGAHVSTLDPLGAELEPGWALYPQLLRGLTEDMRACN